MTEEEHDWKKLYHERESQNNKLIVEIDELQEEITELKERLKIADFIKKLEELTNKSTFNGAMESVVRVNDILNLIKHLEGK